MAIRVLMSPPRFTPRLPSDRCWVTNAGPLDPQCAVDQWEQFRALVDRHIAPVVELPAEPWAPAMTFTRDLALVDDRCVLPLMPDSTRGPFEAPLAHRYLGGLGLDVQVPAHPLRFDGGNVLADSHGRLLIGVATTEPNEAFVAAVRFFESATGRDAYRVPLAGGRFPHIDMAVCDLNGKAWLVYPDVLPGFDLNDPLWQALFLGRPVIQTGPDDGEKLACNLVVHGDIVVGPHISVALQQQIENHQICYISTPLGELLKAGGGAHCLTLELPVVE